MGRYFKHFVSVRQRPIFDLILMFLHFFKKNFFSKMFVQFTPENGFTAYFGGVLGYTMSENAVEKIYLVHQKSVSGALSESVWTFRISIMKGRK